MLRPTYFTGVPISAGDWIRVFVPSLGLWHHGIVNSTYWNGRGWAVEVAHNVKFAGVTLSDWYLFSNRNIVLLHARHLSAKDVEETLYRVEAGLGGSYRLFAQNCEHFASFAFSGCAASKSVQTAGWIATGIAVVGWLTSES